MRKLFWLIFILSFTFLIIFTSKVFARGGDDIVVRLSEHFEMKRLTNHHGDGFDSIEITAYLTHIMPGVYTDIPDTIHYLASYNGKQLMFSKYHKVIISESGCFNCGYYDQFIQGVDNKYNIYRKDRCFFDSNMNEPNQWIWSANFYYLKPNYKTETRYNWDQIKVWLKYNGLEPKPNGSYCFGNELIQNLRNDNYYHIDHVNWYNNGFLLENKDSIFTITEPGNYYAEIVSNFGYKYYSDTIKITTYQFAKYTDCIDAQIEANNESKITGKKGFEDIINKKLSIYPNPVNDFIGLDFKTCNEVNANFELYNLSGIRLIQKIFHFNKDENSQVQLDLTGVSPGLYVLCFDFNGIKKRTKIIKQ